MIVYLCIGNSDDKLTQNEWAQFVEAIDQAVGAHRSGSRWFGASTRAVHVHGRWFAAPDVPWQSACWCIEFDYDQKITTAAGKHTTLGADLHVRLADAAHRYRQDSIAWAQAPITELIKPGPIGAQPPPANAPVTEDAT